MIVLPAMPAEQTASRLGLLDLHERLAEGWTLIGSAARDFRNEDLSKKDRQRLRAMVAAVRKDRALLLDVPGAERSPDRLSTVGES